MKEIRDLSDMKLCWLLLTWALNIMSNDSRSKKILRLALGMFNEQEKEPLIVHEEFLLVEAQERIKRRGVMFMSAEISESSPIPLNLQSDVVVGYMLLDHLSRAYFLRSTYDENDKATTFLDYEASFITVAFQLLPLPPEAVSTPNVPIREVVQEAESRLEPALLNSE